MTPADWGTTADIVEELYPHLLIGQSQYIMFNMSFMS